MKMKKFPGGNGVRFVPVAKIVEVGIEGRAADQPKMFRVAVSSEVPVDRMGWEGPWREVLGHDAGEVQMERFQSGRAAVLEEHRGAPVGVIDEAMVGEDRVMRADIRFSRSARGVEIQQDVVDEIRGNISVGYIPKRARLVEENATLGDLWRVTLWEPVELSIVGVPADATVGVGRAIEEGMPVEVEGQTKEEITMKRVRGEKGVAIEVADDDPRPAITEERAVVEAVDRDAERNAIRSEEVERTETIRALAAMNALPSERADEAVRKGTSVVEFTREIVRERATKGAAPPSAETLDGMSAKDRSEYSFVRAMRLGAGIAAREKGDDTDDDFRRVRFDGLEADVHRALSKAMPDNAERRGGILIPMDLRTREEQIRSAYEKRTMSSVVAGKGAESVFDSPGEFIELLRTSAVVAQMGARFLTGLSGPIGFVKQTGGVTVFWMAENPGGDVADSDVALGIVTMAPKTLMASTGYTRQLLMQSSLQVEAMARTEFAEAHARAIDKAAYHGKGAAGEPMGIYLAPGVGSVAMGGAPTFAKCIDLETTVFNANAGRGRLGFVTTPTVAGKAMQTPEHATAVVAGWLWAGPFEGGRMANYPAVATTQLSQVMNASDETGGASHGFIFGNWAEVLFGLYNTMEIVVDPYRLKKRGVIEVTSFQMADLILRHGESFAKGTGATG